MTNIIVYPTDLVRGTGSDDYIMTMYNSFTPHHHIFGGGGNDLIRVQSWSFSRNHPIYWHTAEKGDRIDGGSGNDTIFGPEGGNNLFGGKGNDVIHGGSPVFDPDFGEPELDDIIDGGSGRDVLFGDGGNDRIFGGDDRDTVDGGTGKDTIMGGKGSDSLAGGKGDDELHGGSGDDILIGGSGQDWLEGAVGHDRFVFTKASDTSIGHSDTISDFHHGSDIVDLSLIDARNTKSGDQAFTFVATKVFSHHAGELRYEITANGITVLGDIDGNGKADFAFDLVGVHSLVAGDFIL